MYLSQGCFSLYIYYTTLFRFHNLKTKFFLATLPLVGGERLVGEKVPHQPSLLDRYGIHNVIVACHGTELLCHSRGLLGVLNEQCDTAIAKQNINR